MFPGVIEYGLIVLIIALAITFFPPAIIYWLSATPILTIETTSFWKLMLFWWLGVAIAQIVKEVFWKLLNSSSKIKTPISLFMVISISGIIINFGSLKVSDFLISSVNVSTATTVVLAVVLTIVWLATISFALFAKKEKEQEAEMQ